MFTGNNKLLPFICKIIPFPFSPSALDGARSKRTLRKPKFPCKLCKGDHLLKECPDLSRVQEEWYKRSKPSMSSTSNHHVDDTPSTSDPLVKGRKGKFLYTCLTCKAMHRTFLCPSMDEALRWLENIIDHQQVIPTSDSKLSLDPPLVDQVVNSDSSIIDATLPS